MSSLTYHDAQLDEFESRSPHEHGQSESCH